MASYALSGNAAADILHIARTSIDEWGVERAEAYILAYSLRFRPWRILRMQDGTPATFVAAIIGLNTADI